MTHHPDTRFIEALLRNEHPGITEIYSRFADRIERFVCANSGSSDDARDIFQEALLTITRQARRPEFVLSCPFEAYLYLVCRGKWLNELKRRKRAAVTIEEAGGFTAVEDAGVLADSTLFEDARNRLFRRIFEQLSAGCRRILQLSWSGISMEEVSVQLGLSYGFARKRKAECIALLISRMQAAPEFTDLK